METKFKDILLHASDSSVALRELYLLYKKKDSKYSLKFICRTTGVSSTGYLSDVFQGKRTLNSKYNMSLLNFFKVKGIEREVLGLLFEIDQVTKSNHKKELKNTLKLKRKLMTMKRDKISTSDDSYFIALIFCSFGLLENKHSSFEDICSQLRGEPSERIESALNELLKSKYIEKLNEKYSLVDNDVLFTESSDDNGHLRFLEDALDHGKAASREMFDLKEETFFESNILSVDLQSYKEYLVEYKKLTKEFLAKTEVSSGDTLVHFNIQIYPNNGISVERKS